MTDFISQYRAAFEAVGRPLTAADAISEEKLEAAQQRLGIKLPKALFDFYRVAGNSGYFNYQSQLWELNELGIDEGKLIFFGDGYGVVWFGLDLPLTSADPLVIFSEDYSVCGLCSIFLTIYVYIEAAQGGMPFTAEATVGRSTLKQLESQWESAIQLGHWQVYKQSGRVIFLWSSGKEWELRVGVTAHCDLKAIARELNIELKEVEH